MVYVVQTRIVPFANSLLALVPQTPKLEPKIPNRAVLVKVDHQ
jgi:hypothetical protein